MISEYSKVRIKTTRRVGIIVEFHNREGDAIHLIELTDTDADDRIVWADSGDLEELDPMSAPQPMRHGAIEDSF